MEIKGIIKLINETQTFDSGFTKREVVVTTQEQYPQDIKVEFVKDKCQILDNYNIGDPVEVAINLRGNEYQGKYYVSIQGWKISKSENNAPQPASTDSGEDDDLPF